MAPRARTPLDLWKFARVKPLFLLQCIFIRSIHFFMEIAANGYRYMTPFLGVCGHIDQLITSPPGIVWDESVTLSLSGKVQNLIP